MKIKLFILKLRTYFRYGRTKPVVTDKYIVIHPDQIKKPKKKLMFPYHGFSKNDYLNYLAAIQPAIDTYEQTNNVEEACETLDNNADKNAFLKLFDPLTEITVNKDIDGSFYIASNGRHRLYTAREYKYKIIAHMTGERIKKSKSPSPH